MVALGPNEEPDHVPEPVAGTDDEPVVRPRTTKKPKHAKRNIDALAVIPETSSLDEQNPMNDPAIANSPVSVDQSSADARKKQKRTKVDKSRMKVRTRPDKLRVSLQNEPAAPMESELTPEPSEGRPDMEAEGALEQLEAASEQPPRTITGEVVPPVFTLQQLIAMATSGELARVLGQTTISTSEPSPVVPPAHEPLAPEVVDCSQDEPVAEVATTSNLASLAMGQIPPTTPTAPRRIIVPPPKGPLRTQADKDKQDAYFRRKDREARLAEELAEALNQPETEPVVPCPQWQLSNLGNSQGSRSVRRPTGWPGQSVLHTLEPSELYDRWFAARKEGIVLSQQTEPSTCRVPGVQDKFIPSGWATEWNALYMEYLKEKAKYRTVDTDSVVDQASFEKWWNQPQRPESVVLGLLQYTFPEPGEVPQWPTLSQFQVKAAFGRLVQTPAILESIRDALEDLEVFEDLLTIQWGYFDQLHELQGLPPLNPVDRRILLKLPTERYEPGAQPFQTTKTKKKVDWGASPPPLPDLPAAGPSTSQPVQNQLPAGVTGGVIPGISISTRAPYASALKTPRPALNPAQTMGPPMSREPQRRRTEETLGSMDRRTMEQVYLDSCAEAGIEPVFDIRYTLRVQDQGMATPQDSNVPDLNNEPNLN